MQAGRLSQPVELLRSEVAVSASGSGLPVEEFVAVSGVVWAQVTQVTPVGGNEPFLALERTAETTHTFRIRYRDDIEESWRLRWNAVEFGITSIVPGGGQLREFLDVLATASKAERTL